MKYPAFLFLLLGLFLPFLCPGQATVPDRAQIIRILQTSVDLPEVVAALKVAVADPALRPLAIAYFDGPSRYQQMRDTLRAAHPAEYAANEDKTTWQYFGPLLDGFRTFLVQDGNLDYFPVFTHYCESELGYHAGGGADNCRWAAQNLKLGSPWEFLFLDYLQHAMFDLYYLGYDEGNGQATIIGVFNNRTGKYDSLWIAGDTTALKAGKEFRLRFLRDYGLLYMALIKSDQALQRVLQIAALPECSEFDVRSAINGYRYDPYTIPLFGAALNKARREFKPGLVRSFFEEFTGWSEDSPLPLVETADPKAYPGILAFIAEAEKINFTEQENTMNSNPPDYFPHLLADHKARVLALYAKHGLTPPTAEQLAEIAESWKGKPSVAVSDTSPEATTPKPSPTPVRSLSSSTPLFILGGLAVVVGLFVFLRRK